MITKKNDNVKFCDDANIFAFDQVDGSNFKETIFNIFEMLQSRKLYIKRNNNKVDSIETGWVVISHLPP